MEKIIKIYTDGGARGNPGPAGIGIVFYGEKNHPIEKYSQAIGNQTNNQAEYEAVIFALKKAKKLKFKNVECFSDSELIVNQLSHKYKIKDEKLQPLFIQVWNLMIDFNKISFYHIPREENKEADKLVNQVLNNQEKLF
jgi:ribonuclease HI